MKNLKSIHKKLGVFTYSDSFAPYITEFKKQGINIQKLNPSDQLEDFSSVFIDLSHPLEMGYLLLDKIISDSSLSDINIFVLISKKAEWENVTQAQNSRICDYFSLNIPPKELLNKVDTALSPENQPKKRYENAPLKVKVRGSMTHISESGALISSQVSFNDHSRIEITSNLLHEVTKGEELIFQVSNKFSSPGGNFLSEVEFLNLSDKSRTEIRKMILGWSLK